jgi:hypothetical protein
MHGPRTTLRYLAIQHCRCHERGHPSVWARRIDLAALIAMVSVTVVEGADEPVGRGFPLCGVRTPTLECDQRRAYRP